MKKISFIVLMATAVGLIVYYYNEEKNIADIMESLPQPTEEVVFMEPDDGVDYFAETFPGRVRSDEAASESLENSMITVGPERVECIGLVPMDCLLVNGELFYDDIVGFEYEPGYIYQLEVQQIFLEEPMPADASSWYYELVSVISKDIPYIGTSLLDRSWVWQSYVEDAATLEPKQAGAFVMSFDTEGRVSGTTDCNNYFGSYSVTTSSLSIGQLASTKMACFHSQEDLYHNLLGSVATYTLENDILILSGADNIQMIFKAKEKTSE